MKKTLRFQASLTCIIDGREASFKSNEVLIDVLQPVSIIDQKSIPIDSRCFDFSYGAKAYLHKEREGLNCICLLLILLFCK